MKLIVLLLILAFAAPVIAASPTAADCKVDPKKDGCQK